MDGPGSGRGKRSFGRISRGGGSRGSRGGRRPTLAQDMTPMEEENHVAEDNRMVVKTTVMSLMKTI
jgi:hypothetical protein